MRKITEWSQEELELLKEKWVNNTPKEVYKFFPNKDSKVVHRKAATLKLKRSEEVYDKILEERRSLLKVRNKLMGRDMTYEFAKTEALKYKSKTEMYKNDNSLYQFIYKNGHWDDLCSHMVNFQFNYSQMFLYTIVCELFPEEVVKYNDRKAIKPLELDIYIPRLNLAFEYDGSNFHFQDDVIYRDDKKEELCKDKSITLYRIKEIREERAKPENFILNQVTALGFDCNHLDIQDLIEKTFSRQMSGDTIKSIVNQYDSYKKFVRNEKQLSDKLRKKGLLDKYVSHFTDRSNLTDEEIVNLVNSYSDKGSFRADYASHFVRIFKRKAEYPLSYSAYNNLPSRKSNNLQDKVCA
jgi:hypothetical protein